MKKLFFIGLMLLFASQAFPAEISIETYGGIYYAGFIQQAADFFTFTIKVEKGDCLWNITKKINQQHPSCVPMTWQCLYKKNVDIIGNDPDLILSGMTLVYKTYAPAGRTMFII